MYQPSAFREENLHKQHEFIIDNPLGLLISFSNGIIEANPVPFLLDKGAGNKGTLNCHLAKANPQLDQLAKTSQVLIVFQGTQNYISPSLYATKKQHGKVVPTWNYTIVQAGGVPELVYDQEWLHAHLSELSNRHENSLDDPWSITDAPEKFITAQIRGIVGVKIPVDRLEAKFKLSQNRQEIDKQSLAEGLKETHPQMAKLIKNHM